jgi:AcrR family transcriptional regulator
MAGLREQKKARTRAAIQQAAVALIEQQGYGRTTCEQIAGAAGVSPATFFRYFPTKEDVVLGDDYDPMIADLVAGRPAGETPLTAVRAALAAALAAVEGAELDTARARALLIASEPALRARSHEQSESLRGHLARAVAARTGADQSDLEVQVLAAAAAAALDVAVRTWAREGGELPALVDRALGALADLDR